jgi:glycosyltransferase involved in cell wall biosynthesis
MRIVGFIRIWPTHQPVGGLQLHARNLYRGLAARGHEVHVLTTAHPDFVGKDNEQYGLTVHYLAGCRPGAYSEAYFHAASHQLRVLDYRKPIDVIHSESSCASRELSGKWGVVATWHGLEYCALRTALNKARVLERNITTLQEMQYRCANILREMETLKQYDQSIAISDQAYQELGDIYGISSHQRSLVFNGFDTNQFVRNETLRMTLRRRYAIGDDIVVVGIVGRLAEDKGHRQLAAIIPEVTSRNRKVTFLIAGEGSGVDAYKQLSLDCVRYIGALCYEDMPALYNAFDLLINPTMRHEGLDMTIQEAMLCGVPVLATDVGSIRRSLLPGWCHGTTFTLGDHGDMLQKLLALIGRNDLKILGEAACRYGREKFSLERMCVGTEEAMICAIDIARQRHES